MTNANLIGKPDVENPHVRFDVEKVTSKKPRRGVLLSMKCTVLMACVAGLAQGAVTWTIYPTDVDGRTPTEQLTNAVARAAANDVISFEAGTYQLDGKSYMQTYTEGSGTSLLTVRNYLAPDKALIFVGPAGERWNNTVVLRGTGIDRFIEGKVGTCFRNLTFENFASNDHPEKESPNGNLDHAILGGAVYFPYNNTSTLFTNCVFRENVSRSGGAFARGYAVDCLFTNNMARSYIGGAAVDGSYKNCLFVNNVATNIGVNGGGKMNCYGGAIWWPAKLEGCTLRGNRSLGNGGAVIGQTSTTISDCVFTGNASLNGGGGAIMLRQKMAIKNCIFENNTAAMSGGAIWGDKTSGTSDANGARGTRISGCAFIGNHADWHGGAAYEYLLDAGDELPFTDCVFTNNTATIAGGALCGGAISNCTFVGNMSAYQSKTNSVGHGGAVYARGRAECWVKNSVFISNRIDKVDGSTWGCAIFAMTNNLVQNCIFIGNASTNNNLTGAVVSGERNAWSLRLVDCAFTNNYVNRGGVARYADCTNTTFFGNEVIQNAGVVWQSRAVDCRFIGNRKYDTFYGYNPSSYGGIPAANNPAGDAYQSDLVACDLDLGCVYDSTLVNCTIHSLTNKGAYCAFYGHNVATNCLIANCKPNDPDSRGLIYRWGSIGASHVKGSDYVNCTFAENTYSYFLHFANETTVETPFKNCLFYNNHKADGTARDVFYGVKSTNVVVSSGLSLSNCVYGSVISQNTATWCDLGGNLQLAAGKVKIAGDKAAKLGVPKYALCAESPILGRGDASMFTAADTDLAGNPRLRDGRLDPGCYECWLNPTGTLLLFR